jgi:hypothetical protein
MDRIKGELTIIPLGVAVSFGEEAGTVGRCEFFIILAGRKEIFNQRMVRIRLIRLEDDVRA